MKKFGLQSGLNILGCVWLMSVSTNLVASPTHQSSYESIHSGQVQVLATIFNAPCNMTIKTHQDVVQRVSLTKTATRKMLQQTQQTQQQLQPSQGSPSLSTSVEIALTECGAGSAYQGINSLGLSAPTHTQIHLYDVKQKRQMAQSARGLLNGNNTISFTLPSDSQMENAYRLEVNYD